MVYCAKNNFLILLDVIYTGEVLKYRFSKLHITSEPGGKWRG